MGRLKIGLKNSLQHPGVARGTSTHGFGGSGVPGRRPSIKEIDETMNKNHEVEDLTRRWAVGLANFTSSFLHKRSYFLGPHFLGPYFLYLEPGEAATILGGLWEMLGCHSTFDGLWKACHQPPHRVDSAIGMPPATINGGLWNL